MANPYDRKLNNSTNYVHPNETNLWELHKAMAYDVTGRPVLRVDDTTVQHTSKNRKKTSNQSVTFYNTFQYTKDAEVWDENTALGGFSEHESFRGQVRLEVGSQAGSEIIRQTRKVVRYVPGRSNELTISGSFDEQVPGVRKRAGIFDEFNGTFFENLGDEFFVVTRRNTPDGVVEERVEQEFWNRDRLDGTGTSGVIADARLLQLLVIEYEWYGAGHVEFKLVINNESYSVHEFNHANVTDRPWSQTPFLPVRIEVTNLTGESNGAVMYQGSNSLSAEGNVDNLGTVENVSSPITGTVLQSAETFLPCIVNQTQRRQVTRCCYNCRLPSSRPRQFINLLQNS
jgi:hypothetical protein